MEKCDIANLFKPNVYGKLIKINCSDMTPFLQSVYADKEL